MWEKVCLARWWLVHQVYWRNRRAGRADAARGGRGRTGASCVLDTVRCSGCKRWRRRGSLPGPPGALPKRRPLQTCRLHKGRPPAAIPPPDDVKKAQH